METEYFSATQIAKNLDKRISGGIATKDVQWALRQLGYIDFKNRPTEDGIIFCQESRNFKNFKYYKWNEIVAEEVGDLLYERSFKNEK